MKLAVRPSGLESSDPHQNPLHGLFVSHLLQDMWHTAINTHAYMHMLTHMHPTVRVKKMKVRCVSICVWYWEIMTLRGKCGREYKNIKNVACLCNPLHILYTASVFVWEPLELQPWNKAGYISMWWQIGFWQNFCLWEVWVLFGDN